MSLERYYAAVKEDYGQALWMTLAFAPSTVDTPVKYIDALRSYAARWSCLERPLEEVTP
jgi:hypothetical protein